MIPKRRRRQERLQQKKSEIMRRRIRTMPASEFLLILEAQWQMMLTAPL
jgi:hypothetical protein